MKTPSFSADQVERKWYVVDAKDQNLGRLSTRIATVLRGKNKPTYTPHADTGDFVIVVNAEHIGVTGNKEDAKLYWRHTGYPGGERSINVRDQREKHPERIVEHAVKGMLPKGPLGRKLLRKLKVYQGDTHPHLAQKPEPLGL